MSNNFTTAPQSSVLGIAAKIVPQTASGGIVGQVGSTPVIGIQEKRWRNGVLDPGDGTAAPASKTAAYTVPAGALAVDIRFASDFVGTIYGLAYTGADDTGWHDQAAPGNTMPAVPITRSAGSYDVIESRP